MTAPEGLPPPPTHIAGYRVERVLAVTAMATVYLVHSPTLPRREVLKVLQADPGSGEHVRAQFLHEADITAGLEHPNIVRVFSRGETDTGHLWIAMEYVEGTNAETALNDGQMTPARAVHIITEVARALDYAHARGVVHQDIKPSNFLLAAEKLPGGLDRVVLTDFGAALSPHSRGAGDGPLNATLAYSAPEVITGDALDGRADVYALACTLFRLLTGEHPYPTDAGVGATVKAHLDTTPPRVSDRLSWASPQLDSVIAKALAKSPAARYSTAGAFAAAASAALTLPHSSAPASPPADRDTPPPNAELGGAESHGAAADFISLLPHTRAVSQRRQLLAALAVAAVLIVALSVWLIGRGSDSPDAAPTAAPSTTSTAPSAALEDLRRLLPSGYPAGACTPAASSEGATVITCGPNTDPGGPRSATYTLADGPAMLRTTFDELVESTTVVVCPGNIQSPGPWRRNDTPAVTRGTVLCGLSNGSPRVVWTNEAERLIADVESGGPNGPRLDQLYAWWGTHS
ncbi:serine/threonine-protein kinase [Mycobacterium sp. pW049]|uniref:serine/threonine-protein kinase n=1 Tax=[Mycobacterium] bulgaricum TaxID=3238985 RepID=UPI00351AD754